MIKPKTKARKFQGMSYVEVQRHNSQRRAKLTQEEQVILKQEKYKNIGWDNVINLFYRIEELLDRSSLDDLSLEELFLEADRVGNKYQSKQEIDEFNQKLAAVVNEVADEIDRQFPTTEIEMIDFSRSSSGQPRRKIRKK